MGENKYIRFDWAAKRILRDKENFCILEGLGLSVEQIMAATGLSKAEIESA